MNNQFTPDDLGVKNVNLKAVATTKYPTLILDLRRYHHFNLSFLVDNTGGGAAGVAKITTKLFAEDGATVLLTIDTLTAIDTLVDRFEQLCFGNSRTAGKIGNGTLATDFGLIQAFSRVQFIVEVVTASDATTCTGSLYLFAQA
jgi:hypothetical protein